MKLRIFRHRSEPDEHQANGEPGLGVKSGERTEVGRRLGGGGARPPEPDSERPWWIGRPLPAEPDEADEPRSLSAA
jgi:hypothetical protein